MWEYAKEQITREIGAVSDLGQKIKIMFVVLLFISQVPPSQIRPMSG
jgi:hypothetical protein